MRGQAGRWACAQSARAHSIPAKSELSFSSSWFLSKSDVPPSGRLIYAAIEIFQDVDRQHPGLEHAGDRLLARLVDAEDHRQSGDLKDALDLIVQRMKSHSSVGVGQLFEGA